MTFPIFLELVEMKAKTASVLPFLIALAFSAYHEGGLNWLNVCLYFLALFAFNMFVDIWDNYNDYRHAVNDDYKRSTNIIGRENLSLRQVEGLMGGLFSFAAIIGLVLVYLTGWPLLIMGVFCFAVGLFYAAGPRPLSSLPLGEFFSGFTMGFMISLIGVYLCSVDQFVWSWEHIGQIALISLPNTLWIANLMLANNLCDKEEDESNHRYTLVHYTGIKGGLWLFALGNALAFIAILWQVMAGLAPVTVLLTWLLIPIVWKLGQKLWHKQVKRETFPAAVKILALGSAVHFFTYLLGFIF